MDLASAQLQEQKRLSKVEPTVSMVNVTPGAPNPEQNKRSSILKRPSLASKANEDSLTTTAQLS